MSTRPHGVDQVRAGSRWLATGYRLSQHALWWQSQNPGFHVSIARVGTRRSGLDPGSPARTPRHISHRSRTALVDRMEGSHPSRHGKDLHARDRDLSLKPLRRRYRREAHHFAAALGKRSSFLLAVQRRVYIAMEIDIGASARLCSLSLASCRKPPSTNSPSNMQCSSPRQCLIIDRLKTLYC